MHGLINRSIQCFICDTHGADAWQDIARAAGLGFDRFEAMLEYDDALTYAVLDAAAERLSRPREMLMEDLGTFLVTNQRHTAPRRLLRFCGLTFIDFLHSLDDLHDRARLAVPELELPRLELVGYRETGDFSLYCRWRNPGFGHVMIGILRAMADDYGALVFLEHMGTEGCCERISIRLLEAAFSEGRHFSLSQGFRPGSERGSAQVEIAG